MGFVCLVLGFFFAFGLISHLPGLDLESVFMFRVSVDSILLPVVLVEGAPAALCRTATSHSPTIL